MARRLLITYLTITVLTLAAVVVPLGRLFADREHDQLTFDIERDAQAVASLVEDSLEAEATPAIDAVLTDYRRSGGRIVVVDGDGISVADSDRVGGVPRDFSTRPEIAAALGGDRSTGSRASDTLASDLIYVAIPVASGGTVHGAVRITYPTSTLDARVTATWRRLGLLSAVVLGAVALVGLVFARGVARPVRRLQQASERLATGDLEARVDPSDGPRELRELAVTFNTTAEQLAQLIESQHRFVADASHQLRTPLTALRLRLETLGPFVAEPARPKLDAAITETDRLSRLVHSLLVLARSDAAAARCVPVDLGAAVRGRIDAWAPAAADERVDLVARCPQELWVDAVPGAIEQILDNVIANAVAAAPPATTVTVEVTSGDGVAEVHVIDQGPGMPPEARQQAFERFWRAGDRPGDGGSDGFGLGLAIVERLAAQCGGHARLDQGPDGTGLDAVVSVRTLAPAIGGEPPSGQHRRPASNL